MARSTSNYAFQKMVIDALKRDGALCSTYEKEYDEQGTYEGGSSNRYVFKSYNDRISNYHTILKVLTGEQRANLSEAIPVIDFLHPSNTGFMNTYPIDDRGSIDPTTIISIPTDSSKSALDYIEEDDPYILNRALSGSDMMNHFYNTNGGFISESNIQASPWSGEYSYRYHGILNPKVTNPNDKNDVYSSLRKTGIFAINASSTVWIDVDFSTSSLIGSKDPKEITLNNYSTSDIVDSTGNNFVRIISNQEMSICLDPGDICVIFPDSSYSADTTKILIFKNNGAVAGGTGGEITTTGGNSWIPYVASLDSFQASVTPEEIVADTIIPDYLKDEFIVKYMNLYADVEKEYYSNASGLINGIYCEPCEYTDNFDGSQSVTKWKLCNEVDAALEKGIPIEVGDKYFKGHILKRGLILDSPLQTTASAEKGYIGKATYMYDAVTKNISGLFKNVQVDINRWQNFSLREVETVTNKADYSGERLSSAEREDYLGSSSGSGVTSYLDTSNMIYPDKLKTKDGKSISYDEIREIIEKCTSSKMYGNRINYNTITLDLTASNDGVSYSIARIDNGTILNWGLITNENGRWTSGGDIKTDYNVEYSVKFAHRHKKILKGFWPHAEYPLDDGCSGLEINMTSPINIFSKTSNPTANVVLVYPEYNKYFPENLFLFSRVNLGLQKFTGDSYSNLPSTKTAKGICSFYNVNKKCVISFKVEEAIEFLPSRVKYANIKEAVDPGNFSGWHKRIPCTIGSPRVDPDDPTETIGDPSNDCYIYILSPMEMSLERVIVYDQDGDPINLAGSESRVSLMPMAYPSNYFPVTIKKDSEGNNICVVSQGNRKTDIKKLVGSYVIPGIPEFKDPSDLRKIKHSSSGLSMGIFADLLSSGLESITSNILRQGLYQLLYKWPISTGDAGNNISNPIYLGDLKDTLKGLEELGPSLSQLAKSGNFTISCEGNLITAYTNDGNKTWEELLNTSAAVGDKYKITTSSGTGTSGAIYECIKEVTESKEREESDYWGNYWEKISQEELEWEDFIELEEANLGDAILITTLPDTSWVPEGHSFTSVICKKDFDSTVEITSDNWKDYWEVVEDEYELEEWQDLLNIASLDVSSSYTMRHIKGKDPEEYIHQLYNYKNSQNLTTATKELADSNYWENYWKVKIGLSWKELLDISSANVNDVYYLENADIEGERGVYYGCVSQVTEPCIDTDPEDSNYWEYYWKKRPAVSRKAIKTEDVDNIYKRIDYDDPTFRKLEFKYGLDKSDSNWKVITTPTQAGGGTYDRVTDTLEDLISRRLNLIRTDVKEYEDPHPRPSFVKLRTLMEGMFDEDAHITREACEELDKALGNNTRAFLNFGDPSGRDKSPEEANTLEEGIYGYIKQVIIESDHDIKVAQAQGEKDRIDLLKKAAYQNIDDNAKAEYNSTVGPEEIRKVNENTQARAQWDEWANKEVYLPYYTSTSKAVIATDKNEARNILDQIRDGRLNVKTKGLFNLSLFSSWLYGWSRLSLNDFISKYQLNSTSYTLQRDHHIIKIFGWVIAEWYTTPGSEYTNQRYHNLIKEIYNNYVGDLISKKINQNPKPEEYIAITEEEYIKSQEELYEVYQAAYTSSYEPGSYSYQLPNKATGDQEVVNSTISFSGTGAVESFSITENTLTYEVSTAGEITLSYYITILKNYPLSNIPSGTTVTAPDAYPTYKDLTINQIDNYIINNNNLNYSERFKDTTLVVSGVTYNARADVINLKMNLPQYSDTSWNAISKSNDQYDEPLKGYYGDEKKSIEIPLKMVDVASSTLEGVASFIKTLLEGSGNGSGFVKYVKGQESDGIPSGRKDSLYYKRWQILNNRLNRTNGPLYQAANYLENMNNLNIPASYQKGVVSSYKNFLEILPIADVEPLTYMKRAAATATTVELPGKFYFQKELNALAEQISSKCILTCNKCTQQKHCPFYNEEEIIKLYCDECQTIDLWVKDNEVDLLYYSDGEVDEKGEIINRSPYLVYTDENGYTEELSHDLFKQMNLPFADIKTKVGNKSDKTSYQVRDLEQLRKDLKERYSEFKDNSRNSIGWLLGGRYGTISYNSFSELENEAYPDIDLPKYKYLYDALFLDDEVSYISYGESQYAYPVSVALTDERGTKKVYTGTTKLKMPRSLKLFKNANPEWDLYLASDDTKDADGVEISPLIYLGTIGNLQLAFDLQDDPITDEKLNESDTKLYAKDVAQWCANVAKGTCMYDPLNSHMDTNINKDQYWMGTIKKSIITNGNQTWLTIDGRKRKSSGYQEPVLDPENVDETMVIAGKPLVNSYQNFLRKVSIRMNDGKGNDLIPWVKEGSGLDVEIQKSILPLMKTNLRLVVVKAT